MLERFHTLSGLLKRPLAMRRWLYFVLFCFLTLQGLSIFARAYDPNQVTVENQVPEEYKDVGSQQNLGQQLDLSLSFLSDEGKSVRLGDYFKDRPVLLTMVYYTCPNLCNYHLNGVTEALKQLQWTTGKEFQLVAVSMNEKETPKNAAVKKAKYLKAYAHPGADKGWHFLTGSKENIDRLAQELGFKFKWIEKTQQFAHVSVSYIVTPEGKISRYLYGINFEPQTVKLALLEASQGKIGSLVDQLILFCCSFDPTTNKYTVIAWRVMQVGGTLMLLVLGILLIPYWIREQRRKTSG